MQDVRSIDLAEGYTIAPLRGGKKNTVHGLTVLINNAVFPYFLEQHLVPANQDVIDYVAPRFAVRFTSHTDGKAASKQGFGFSRGIRLGRTVTGDWTSHTQIHVLFQQARKAPKWGWPGYSFVLNMNWLLRSLQVANYPEWAGDGARQLFAIHNGFSGGFVDTGFPLTVTVGQACHQMLMSMWKGVFTRAERGMTEARRYFHLETPDGIAKVQVSQSGLLYMRSEPWRMNDDSGECGYKLYSAGIDDPVGQIVLLTGIARVWEELRNQRATPA